MSRVGPDVVGRRLADRFVLVNLRTNRIYELNTTASVLWELLEAGSEDSELESKMLERVDVEPGVLRGDIETAMRAMRDAGLVTA
jgi:Coenzyme PQQ synthesis protein D (PqqD)